MRLLLIRHGQTPDNAKGVVGTVVPGPGLTPLGLQQAAAIPEALASEQIDAIYVSTMLRTHLTAAPLAEARGVEVRQVHGLQEIAAGSLEGASDEASIHAYISTIFSWWTDFSARIPGGEDAHEFYSRFDAAIARIAAEVTASAGPTGTAAVFSHGAAIRAWASWSSQNIDASFSRAHHLENTAVVVLEGSPESGWVTTAWADAPIGGEALDDTSAPDPTAAAG